MTRRAKSLHHLLAVWLFVLPLLACGDPSLAPAEPSSRPESLGGAPKATPEKVPTRAHKTPLRRPTSARLHRPTPAPSPRFPYDAEGCHWLYRQEHVPSFYLEVTPETWARLQEDLGLAQQRLDADEDDTPYHPLTSFRYEDVTFRRAQIRLRGNPDFWPGMGKMQFQVSFDEDDRDGHFLGLRKILFDSATFNRSFLRDRLAYSIARESGIAAPCANNARVYVNGEYYGLFTNIEKIDEVFLWHRLRAPMGDLWKRAGWQLKTNKDLTDTVRQQVLVMADSYAALDAVFNIPINIRVLAYEALLPAVDGAWAGGLNGYYYDDPHSGRFVELPWDYDGAFTQSDNKYLDPLRWKKTERYYGRPFFDLIVGDPAGHAAFVDALEELLENHYRPEVLIARVDRWQAQIEQAMREDPNKPFEDQVHYERTDRLRAHLALRARFLRAWIDCDRAGGRYLVQTGCGPAPED